VIGVQFERIGLRHVIPNDSLPQATVEQANRRPQADL